MLQRQFSRLAIATRGDGAMRVIHAARELGHSIALIALYTEAERDALFVRHADEMVCATDELDHAALEHALRLSRADAVWAGWHPLAEQPELAKLCERLGIVFVGPDAAAMRRLADEIAGKPSQPPSPGIRLEVPVLADGEGNAWALGVCDCSCPPLAESSSPGLTSDEEREIMDSARRLLLGTGYRNAATVAFVFDRTARRFWLHDVTPCLGVGHAVTEAVTGLDLVKLQLHLAAGGRLAADPPEPAGHAIEAHVRAESAAPGRLVHLRLPTGPGVRVDTGVAEGDTLPAELDPLICKLIAWGNDRDEALARLRRALADTFAVVDGGATNHGFLLGLLDRPEVRIGKGDHSWLDRLDARGGVSPQRHGDIALLQAAIELADRDATDDRARFYAMARRGRPQATAALARAYELRHRGHAYRLAVSKIAPERYRVTVDEHSIELAARRVGPQERRVELLGRSHRTLVSSHDEELVVEVDGIPHHVSRDDGGIVRALGSALVVSLPVAAGEVVEAGDVVAVVEAMKMESSLTAPFCGRVKQVFVGENVHVAAQAPLLALEPIDQAAEPSRGERVTFGALAADPGAAPDPCRENLRRIEWLVLGYDIGVPEVERTIADLHGQCADLLACDPALIPGEHRLLGMFADLRAVSRPDRTDRELGSDLEPSPREHLHAWLRSLDAKAEGLPARFVERLRRALHHYGIDSLERTPRLEEAGYRLFLSQQRSEIARTAIVAILDRRLEDAEDLAGHVGDGFREVLGRLAVAHEGRDPIVVDLARELRFRYFDEPVIAQAAERVYAEIERCIAALVGEPERPDAGALIREIVECPRPLAPRLTVAMDSATPAARWLLVEAMARRYYRTRALGAFEHAQLDGRDVAVAPYRFGGRDRELIAAYAPLDEVAAIVTAFARHAQTLPDRRLAVLDLYVAPPPDAPAREDLAACLQAALAGVPTPTALHRIVVAAAQPQRGRGMSAIDLFTFRPGPSGLAEDEVLRGLHPMMGDRLQLWRLREFDLERLRSPEDVYLFHGAARVNAKDERLFALAEVRDLTAAYNDRGEPTALPELERVLVSVLETIRGFQARRPLHRRLMWNRVLLHAWPVIEFHPDEVRAIVERAASPWAGLGIEQVAIQGRLRDGGGAVRDAVLRFYVPTGHDVAVEVTEPPSEPLRPLDEGTRRIISARRRGTLHPAEIVKLLAPAQPTAGQPAGEFTEHELTESGRLEPVIRAPATNPTGIVAGTVRNFTPRYPEGMLRVILLGDPTRSLGSLAEPECRRIVAAIDLAEELGVPLEWFALSAGARIAMDSGTETMDWIAAGLRRIVLFTQGGGELNVVVAGINVGAQPYCNAEATMLMHTRGALIMTPDSAMVLAGKQALEYSGGVSAEDNLGIGGYERIMGPNGQAQYWAADLGDACHLLLRFYEHTYVAPGERFPRRARTSDPADRDVGEARHHLPGSGLTRIADVFSDERNRDRKQPFDIRSVMRAVVDADHQPLERWGAMRDAEVAVVWDAHLGGWPVSLIGIESRPLPRRGTLPADGPQQWTSGTLFPRASKKIARALNATAGRRPMVVLANLAGFDGSPESLREWQLEYGAEIARGVVNFAGPIVFCVLSRYHGGTFVVFSQSLNPNLEAVALEGAHASVIGGATAAAVVFAGDVERAAASDERIRTLDRAVADAEGAERQRLRARRAQQWEQVLAEKRHEFATRFDQVHSIERAVRMGSVKAVVEPSSLRRFLIDAVERGICRNDSSVVVDEHAAVVAHQQPMPGFRA